MSFELNIVAAPPPAKPAPKKPSAPKPAAPTQSSEGVSQEAKPLAAAPASQPLIQSAEALSGSSSSSSSSAPAKKRKAQVEQAPPTVVTPAAPDPLPRTTNSSEKKEKADKKKSRYAKNDDGGASSRMLEQQLMGRKQDPSRAAPLPSTVKLDSTPTNAKTTFSATTFDELSLDPYLQRHVSSKLGLTNLTPVQQHAIPLILGGGDLLVRSPTGSGKTLAYALPITQQLVTKGPRMVTREAGTFAVVLVPTRELCLQTHETVEKLANPYPWLVTSCLMGGERRKAEKARLRKGVTLLVGTPGRVADHCEATSAWQLRECSTLVLDEADRLLDLGFQKSIDTILNALERARRGMGGAGGAGGAIGAIGATGAEPTDGVVAQRPARQTVLLSATLNKGLRELAGRSLTDHATLQLKQGGEAEITLPASKGGGVVIGEAGASMALMDTKSAEGADDGDADVDDGNAGDEQPANQPEAPGAAMGDVQYNAPSGLLQSYVLVPTRQRLTALLAFVRSRFAEASAASGGSNGGGGGGGSGDCKMIIFVSSCDEVDFLYELLSVAGEWPNLKEAMKAAGHATARDLVNTPGMWMGGEEEEEEEKEQARWWSAKDGRSYGGDEQDDDEDGGGGRYGDGDGDDEGGGKAMGRKHKGGLPRALARGVGKKAQGDGLSFDCPMLGCAMLRLHGKMSQRDRTQAFVRFRRMRSGVMVCTDVAARGLNLEGVHWIVQQSLPSDAKEYLHRAGRTARLGQRGHAVLMMHPSELPFLSLLREAGVAPKELKFASLQAALCPGGGKKEIYVLELALQRQLETAVAEAAFLHEAASAAYQSYLKGYAAHSKAVRRLVHVGQLHLGHLAKSYGLKEVPSKLSGQMQKKLNNARQGQGTTTYLAGAEYVSKQARQELSGGGMYGKAGKKRKAGLPLAERMKRQKGAQPVGSSAFVSEFGG